MKITVIPDLHGLNLWHRVVEKQSDSDMFVFLGDYFDSYKIPAAEQIYNFQEIISFKKANPFKVKLLFGNHEFHYLRISDETYAGYQPVHSFDIQDQIHSALNQDLIQMCYTWNNYMFTHAGVSSSWCKAVFGKIDNHTIENDINELFRYQPNAFRFTPGRHFSNVGDDTTQTPIWIRPKSLMKAAIDGWIHVVGHTPQNNLGIFDNVVLTDTIGISGEYLTIEDGKMIINKI